jgi:hypothetical protein
MTIEVLSTAWSELKRYINVVDRAEAAETFVNVMIDHDISEDEIRNEFKGDSDIKEALATYFGNNDDDVDIVDDDYIDDDYEEDY